MTNIDKIIEYAKKNFTPVFRDFLFPLQEEYFRCIFEREEPVIVLKAARQSMKSFITALICAIFIIKGKKVVIVAPTFRQTGEVITSHISALLEANRKRRKISRKKYYKINNVNKKVIYNNGAMVAFTANPTALQDGITCDLLIVDEAQDIETEVVKERLQPFILRARQRAIKEKQWHLGKIIVLGRGGLRSSYIETESHRTDALSLKYTADDICNEFPAYATTLNEMAANTPDHIFRANFYCECLPSDATHIFSTIIVEDKRMKEFPHIGIDYGLVDKTVGVALFEIDGGFYIQDVKICTFMTYEENAAQLKTWIDNFDWNEKYIHPELNGVGDAATEILQRHLGVRVIDQGIRVTAQEKHSKIVRLITASESGKFWVANEKIKNMLMSLTYKYNEKTRLISPEHSDVISALIMAIPPEKGSWHLLRK